MEMFLALVALCLSASALPNVPSRRVCPAVTTQPNFDVGRYMGTWYASHHYFDDLAPEDDSKCTSADYTPDENGFIRMISYYTPTYTGKQATLESYLRVPNPNDASKLRVRYPSFIQPGVEVDYYVLATDYDTYAIVYNCVVREGVGYQHIWVATRERHPSAEIMDKVAPELEKNDISRSILRKSDQTDCLEPNVSPKNDHLIGRSIVEFCIAYNSVFNIVTQLNMLA